jgi:presenilin-like A22 family membrane protease
MDVIYRLIGGTMILTAAVITLAILCIYLKITLDKVCKQMLVLSQEVQNLKVEVFYPIAQALMPDKSMKERLTLHGAVKLMLEKNNHKEPKSRIIVPSRP